MSDAMDSDLREVIRRRIALRERDGHERLLLSHIDLRALLDAADERDRLAAQVERVRALAGNWERLDRAFLAAGTAGMSMPAVDAVRQLRERLGALDGAEEAHAHLPITEDADGLTCDICGAELADWAAADEHVGTHERSAG